MEENKKFNNIADFFEKMFGEILGEEAVNVIPIYNGYCNCCFRLENGYHMVYEYHDGVRTQLFICLICKDECKPEGTCMRSENQIFMVAHDKYVTE